MTRNVARPKMDEECAMQMEVPRGLAFTGSGCPHCLELIENRREQVMKMVNEGIGCRTTTAAGVKPTPNHQMGD
jgi:hypothetical protein